MKSCALCGSHAPNAAIEKALRQAFNLGQTYWQQADSESYSQNRKSGETLQKLEALVAKTSSNLAVALSHNHCNCSQDQTTGWTQEAVCNVCSRIVPFALSQRSKEMIKPVAWLFQHEETGVVHIVECQQVEWGFEKNNPRLQKIGPLYAIQETHRIVPVSLLNRLLSEWQETSAFREAKAIIDNK